MDERREEDLFDRQLRDAAIYIDDAGFTRRVLQQLPAPKRRSQSFRAVILIGITLLASVMAYVLSDGGRFINSNLMRLAGLSPLTLLLLTVGIGLLATMVGCVAAISKSREPQS